MDASPPLIGRDVELGDLRRAWREARAGRGGLWLVEGEPGMGKSALVHALAREAGAEMELVARAWPMDRNLPWSVVTASIGGCLRSAGDALRDRLTAGLGDLARLFPDLGFGRPEPLGDPGLEKARLLGALTAVLGRMRPPVLVVIEDAHHADDASLEWLHHAARAAASAPILLVATYRPVAGRRALDALVRSAPRPPIRLGPLDEAATHALIERLLEDASAPLRRTLAARSGGVPLFACSLAAHVREGGAGAFEDDPLPVDVRAMFAQWLDELSPPERALLEALACASGPVEPRALARVAEMDEREMRAPLASLDRAGWIAPTDEPARVRYDLAHPLTREAVVDGLEVTRASALHGRWARALEAAGASPLELAEHYRRAKDAVEDARAIDVLHRAGTIALERLAAKEAARHLESALARAAPGDLRIGELQESLGRALHLAGRPLDAERAYVAAAEGDDPERAARARRAACLVAWEAGAPERAREHVEAGLRAAGDRREARVELLRARLVTLDRSLDHRALADVTDRLEREAEGLERSDAQAEVAMHRSILAFYAGDEAEGRRQLERARSLADGLDLVSHMRWLRVDHASHRALGDAHEALASAERTAAFAAARGAPGIALEAAYQRASACIIAGRYAEADAILEGAARELAGSDQRRAIAAVRMVRALVAALQGRAEEATDALDAIGEEDVGGDPRSDWFVAYARACVAFAEARWEDAAAIERRVIVDGDCVVAPMPTQALGMAAEAHLALGHVERARQIEARLAARDRYARVWSAYLGATRALRDGDAAAAADGARRAADGYDALGCAHDAARARLLEAEALRALDDPAAAPRAHEAHRALEAMGAATDARRARELLRALGERASTRRRPATDEPLSERELEVARLVARGHTNKEVASALFISTSTVSTHLKRIYKRLGLSGRAALATWLADHA